MSLKNETVRCPACGKDVWPCQELDEKGTVIDRCPTEGCRAALTEQMSDKHREGASKPAAPVQSTPVVNAQGQVVGTAGALDTVLLEIRSLASRMAIAEQAQPRVYDLRPPAAQPPGTLEKRFEPHNERVAELAQPIDLDAAGIVEMAKRRLVTISEELQRLEALQREQTRLKGIIAAYAQLSPPESNE